MKRFRLPLIAVFLLACVPAFAQVVDLPTTNGSVSITTGNTFQTVLAATGFTKGQSRRSLTIQNNNATTTCMAAGNCDLCWVFIGSGTATEAKSIQLSATQAYTRYYPYVPSDAIQATCSSNSDTLYIDTQ